MTLVHVANDSRAGRLTPRTASELDFENAKKAQSKTSPGYERGRHEGCDFVTGAPENWTETYRCSEPGTGGCTSDHKKPARCILEKWGETTHAASQMKRRDGVAGTGRLVRWRGSIPTEYRHLGEGTTLVGYNDDGSRAIFCGLRQLPRFTSDTARSPGLFQQA